MLYPTTWILIPDHQTIFESEDGDTDLIKIVGHATNTLFHTFILPAITGVRPLRAGLDKAQERTGGQQPTRLNPKDLL